MKDNDTLIQRQKRRNSKQFEAETDKNRDKSIETETSWERHKRRDRQLETVKERQTRRH